MTIKATATVSDAPDSSRDSMTQSPEPGKQRAPIIKAPLLNYVRISDDITYLVYKSKAKKQGAVGQLKDTLSARVLLGRYLQLKGKRKEAACMFTKAARAARIIRAHGLSAVLYRRVASLFEKTGFPREAGSALILAINADLAASRIKSAVRTYSTFNRMKGRLSPAQMLTFVAPESKVIEEIRRRSGGTIPRAVGEEISPPSNIATLEQTSMMPWLVKNVRRTMGITQTELGRLLGVSQPTIASWEAGRFRPRPEICERLHGLSNRTSDDVRAMLTQNQREHARHVIRSKRRSTSSREISCACS